MIYDGITIKMCLPIFNINDQMRNEVKSSLLDCLKMHETTLKGVTHVSIRDIAL